MLIMYTYAIFTIVHASTAVYIFHNSTKFPFPNQTNSLQFHYSRTQIDTQKLSVTKGKAVTKNSQLHNPYSKQKNSKYINATNHTACN